MLRGGNLFLGDSLTPEGSLFSQACSLGCLLFTAASESCLLQEAISEGKLEGDVVLTGATVGMNPEEADSCISLGASKDILLPSDGPLLASTEIVEKPCASRATTLLPNDGPLLASTEVVARACASPATTGNWGF